MDSIKGCLSTFLGIAILVGLFWGDDIWNSKLSRWNTNWFLKDDYEFRTKAPEPRSDIVLADYLPGGHYYEAVNWRDPRVRDEAEVTFNHMIETAGLPSAFRLRPWREAQRRNSRYDLRKQVQLLAEIDHGFAVANQSGRRFEVFANLAVFGAAVYAGTQSEDPFGTAANAAELGTRAVPSATNFWADQKAKAEMRALARTVFLPREYGVDLDPTHPMTQYLASFDSRL